MEPTISFHNIVRVELTPVREYPAEGGSQAFHTRRLVLTDNGGNQFEVPMFSYEGAAALHVHDLTPELAPPKHEEPKILNLMASLKASVAAAQAKSEPAGICTIKTFNRDGDGGECSQSLPCPQHGNRSEEPAPAAWTPPPMPRPHRWDNGTKCLDCGALRNGVLAKLTCGSVNNLTREDRERAEEHRLEAGDAERDALTHEDRLQAADAAGRG